MIPYAARTTTRRNLAALVSAGWRILLTPCRPPSSLSSGGLPYALDNGKWTAFTTGEPWNESRFIDVVTAMGADADFVVLPDIVEGGDESLALSIAWLDRVLAQTRVVLIATQDGMAASAVAQHLGPRVGLFVGGSTEFKEGTMAMWAAMARERGALCHVGRVNTVRRIRLCAAAGADSFDGSSASKYSVTLPMLDCARHQPDLFAGKPAFPQ